MDTLYPHIVERGNPTIGGLLRHVHLVDYARMAAEPTEFIEIGARLEAVRKSFSDLSQKDWAEKHGFTQTQWNNWEKGVRRIPVECAEKLSKLYGLTLDWIYLGRRDGLAESASKAL